eukprot:6331050-Pyramimonas_sp.AAC.1
MNPGCFNSGVWAGANSQAQRVNSRAQGANSQLKGVHSQAQGANSRARGVTSQASGMMNLQAREVKYQVRRGNSPAAPQSAQWRFPLSGRSLCNTGVGEVTPGACEFAPCARESTPFSCRVAPCCYRSVPCSSTLIPDCES